MIEWMQEMTRIKRKHKSVITNFTMAFTSMEQCEKVYKTEDYYAVLIKQLDKHELFFIVPSFAELSTIIDIIPGNTVINTLYKKKCELKDFMAEKGLSLHSTYQRTTICYNENPYLQPEISPRRKILPKMYDPTCGEYPDMEDAKEIDCLCRRVFDPLCDDMFSIDEWKEKIQNKEILVYRDETGEITAYYLWHLEGKKLYSNMSVNVGAANTLYNMERRIFEEMWNRGIRIFYGWGNLKNTKAHKHAMQEDAVNKSAKSIQRLYCNTYYKK